MQNVQKLTKEVAEVKESTKKLQQYSEDCTERHGNILKNNNR